MTQSNENPKEILNNIIEQLKIGVTNRSHGFHMPTFSCLDNNKEITSRIVVLRSFDPKKYTLSFHTDNRSKKIRGIQNQSCTNFVFYDFKIKTQLRIKTNSLIHYNDSIASAAWNKTKLSSRKCYLAQKSPSSDTDFPEDAIPAHLKGIEPNRQESNIGFENFAVINNEILSIDWLYLSSSGHRRLRIDIKEKKIEYQWLIP